MRFEGTKDYVATEDLKVAVNAAITLERPRDPSHGDLATNLAMVLAKRLKQNPRRLILVACGLLFMRLADLYWYIIPVFSPGHFTLHWMDIAAIVGVGDPYARDPEAVLEDVLVVGALGEVPQERRQALEALRAAHLGAQGARVEEQVGEAAGVAAGGRRDDGR